MMIPRTKEGVLIKGTLDTLECVALINGGTPALVEGQPAGLEYAGQTEIEWDSQVTKTQDGQRLFVTENGQVYLESELVWEPEEEVLIYSRSFVVIGHWPDGDQNGVRVEAPGPNEAERLFRAWMAEDYPEEDRAEIHVDAVLETSAPVELWHPSGSFAETLKSIPNKA